MRFTLAVMLASTLPLTACFEFSVPLGPPKDPVDPRLVGEWRCMGFEAGADSDKVGRLRFRVLDPQHYEVTTGDACDGSDCMPPYRAYITRIGKVTILNAQEIKKEGPDDAKWSFVRVTFDRPNTLHLAIADDDKFKDVPQTSAALARALRRRMDLPGTFEDYMMCVRVAPAREEVEPVEKKE